MLPVYRRRILPTSIKTYRDIRKPNTHHIVTSHSNRLFLGACHAFHDVLRDEVNTKKYDFIIKRSRNPIFDPDTRIWSGASHLRFFAVPIEFVASTMAALAGYHQIIFSSNSYDHMHSHGGVNSAP